jgi:hypothetical protein
MRRKREVRDIISIDLSVQKPTESPKEKEKEKVFPPSYFHLLSHGYIFYLALSRLLSALIYVFRNRMTPMETRKKRRKLFWAS